MIRIETQYFPPIATLSAALKTGHICLEATENYQKGSFRNRMHIATSVGIHPLSIPLQKGKHQKLPIREVQIAYHENWQRQHWQTLQTAYGRAPLWEFYAPRFKPFFEQPFPLLFDFNLAILNELLACFKIKNKITISFSDSYDITESDTIDMRNILMPNNQLPENITFQKYPQLFEDRLGFLPNLSSFDLLMCLGKISNS